MIEIYSDIPEWVKLQAKSWFDLALRQKNPGVGIKMLNDYKNSTLSDYEREFVDFYFNLRMEELLNENNSNYVNFVKETQSLLSNYGYLYKDTTFTKIKRLSLRKKVCKFIDAKIKQVEKDLEQGFDYRRITITEKEA